MPGQSYDAVVLASGPAGSTAAKELTERGLEALLLEAGPDISPADFPLPRRPREKAINWPARACDNIAREYRNGNL